MSRYSRELVEQLLPAVWDRDYAYGMENPTAPDPDMPKARANPKTGCTLYAHLADVRSAWRCAGLSIQEKQALLLRYGLGRREREIAEALRTPQQTVSDRLVRGVGRLVAWLNGDSISPECVK